MGPFTTEAEARRAAIDAVGTAEGSSIPGMQGNHLLLHGTLTAAGVTLGEYDEQIALWLANYEAATIAVIAGWIARANKS
jgi:hypothetical protein